jgi:hypothetical protein
MNTPALPAAAQPALTPPAGAQIFDARDRITILTPCYDYSLTEYYHNSLTACREARAWFRQPDGSVELMSLISHRLSLPNDSHIDRARNVLANMWERENTTTFCLWWDADIPMDPSDIMRLYVHLQKGNPFVCGFYAMKCLQPTFVANIVPGSKPDPETGLIDLLHGATGCMAWHRSVLADLRTHPGVKPYRCAPNTPWPGQKFYAYFTSGVHGDIDPKDGLKNWQSEDWMVCEYWRELGGRVVGDTKIKLRHLGRLLFPPAISELVDATVAMIESGNPAVDRAKIAAALAKHAAAKP